MKSRARTAVTLFGGATIVTLAVGVGGYGELSSSTTTPIATPTSSVTPVPPATPGPEAPATGQPGRGFGGPGGDTGCIPHINC